MLNNTFFSNAFNENVMAITLNSDKTFKEMTHATCRILGYTSSELIGNHFSNIIFSKESIVDIFSNIPSTTDLNNKLIKKNKEIININLSISKDDKKNEYYILLHDQDIAQVHKNSSEFEMALNESEGRKNFLHTILNEQKAIVVVIHENTLIDVNKAFLKKFNVPSLEFYLDNHGECIGDSFQEKENKEYLQKTIFNQHWLEYVLDTPDEMHKVMIKNTIYDVHVVKIDQAGDELFIVTFNDITSLENAQNYIDDSIEYASLIQHSLVPDNEIFRNYASEYFVIWHPKDVVGGDIYFLEELRHNNEMLLFVIDCTGHGVPGAFVTMLVKAIERQVIAYILNSDDDDPVSPAQLLGVFNRSMKNLLKQEDKDSISNAGFDGGILYYNRKDNQLIYAGAKTPLFVSKNGTLEILPGDRHSIGYKRSKGNFSFTDYVIDLDVDTTIYLSTDGYMDQQGEKTGMPLGKSKVISLINEYGQESLSDQQEVFLDEFMEHRGERVANDDVTIVALKFLANK